MWTPKDAPRWLKALAALELTIAAMAALLVLVLACTLAQVHLGTYAAVQAYIRSWLVWWGPAGAGWRVPVFPGGALVGSVLLANLMAADLARLERSRRKAGIWLIHIGLFLLFGGEFVTAAMSIESRAAVEEGRTASYSEEPRRYELALIDGTDPARDRVYAVPQELLERGGEVADARLPVTLTVRRYLPNARLRDGTSSDALADQGVAPRVVAEPVPPPSSDDEPAMPAAWVGIGAGGRPLGTWLLSPQIGVAQGFDWDGRAYALVLRPARRYFPFALTLLDFRHDVYPGTDIPKNFSSRVRLSDPGAGPDRDALISMNNPLRYRGRTFYQSSFGKNDTLSVFQVVENPGWSIPYVSCVLVALGMALHFLGRMRASGRAA